MNEVDDGNGKGAVCDVHGRKAKGKEDPKGKGMRTWEMDIGGSN